MIGTLIETINTVDESVSGSMKNIEDQIKGRTEQSWCFKTPKSIPPPAAKETRDSFAQQVDFFELRPSNDLKDIFVQMISADASVKVERVRCSDKFAVA